MRVTVIALRRNGRRLPDSEAMNAGGVVGELQTATVNRGTSFFMVAWLADPDSQVADHLLPDLYEPTMVQIGPAGFVLRGYGKDDGRAVLQEWHCEAS